MNTPPPMMKCGHAANAVDANGKPCCVICFMVTGDASTQVAEPPKLDGRTAKCAYKKRRDGKPCTSEQPSSLSLAFFEHKPSEPHDQFYCGCWGWD